MERRNFRCNDLSRPSNTASFNGHVIYVHTGKGKERNFSVTQFVGGAGQAVSASTPYISRSGRWNEGVSEATPHVGGPRRTFSKNAIYAHMWAGIRDLSRRPTSVNYPCYLISSTSSSTGTGAIFVPSDIIKNKRAWIYYAWQQTSVVQSCMISEPRQALKSFDLVFYKYLHEPTKKEKNEERISAKMVADGFLQMVYWLWRKAHMFT